MFSIDEPVAQPISEEIVLEFELQTKIRLPASYRAFLLKYNGGHPTSDFLCVPPDNDFPAQFRYFYGLDADEWFCDAWTKFKFFDTWIPFGILMFGELSLECSEVCFDFRKHPSSSFYARLRRFLFGVELLDPNKDTIPVKYFDWRYFNVTRVFREQDLYFVASEFDVFVAKLRGLTPSENRQISPEPTAYRLAKGKRLLEKLKAVPKDWQSEAMRPPSLATLAQQRRSE